MAPLSKAQIEASANFEQIKVDIKSLGDFANLLRAELSKNLEPAMDKLGGPQLLNDEPQFGHSPELELGGKRNDYDQYLRDGHQLLRNLIAGTKAIADAADRIAAQYEGADQFASIQAGQVHAHLPAIKSGPTGTDDF